MHPFCDSVIPDCTLYTRASSSSWHSAVFEEKIRYTHSIRIKNLNPKVRIKLMSYINLIVSRTSMWTAPWNGNRDFVINNFSSDLVDMMGDTLRKLYKHSIPYGYWNLHVNQLYVYFNCSTSYSKQSSMIDWCPNDDFQYLCNNFCSTFSHAPCLWYLVWVIRLIRSSSSSHCSAYFRTAPFSYFSFSRVRKVVFDKLYSTPTRWFRRKYWVNDWLSSCHTAPYFGYSYWFRWSFDFVPVSQMIHRTSHESSCQFIQAHFSFVSRCSQSPFLLLIIPVFSVHVLHTFALV